AFIAHAGLPPALCPLLPYTALFRSRTCLAATEAQANAKISSTGGIRPASRPSTDQGGALGSSLRGSALFGATTRATWAGAVRTTDRKSTRLNSSHVKISYAVFCLEK